MLPSKSSSPSSQAMPWRIRISARKAKVPAATPTPAPRPSLASLAETSDLASSISSRTRTEACSETSTTRSASERSSAGAGGSGGGIGGGFSMRLAGILLLLRRILVVHAAVGDRRDPRGGDARQGARSSQQAAPDKTFDQLVIHSAQTFPRGRDGKPTGPAAIEDAASLFTAARVRRRSSSPAGRAPGRSPSPRRGACRQSNPRAPAPPRRAKTHKA